MRHFAIYRDHAREPAEVEGQGSPNKIIGEQVIHPDPLIFSVTYKSITDGQTTR